LLPSSTSSFPTRRSSDLDEALHRVLKFGVKSVRVLVVAAREELIHLGCGSFNLAIARLRQARLLRVVRGMLAGEFAEDQQVGERSEEHTSELQSPDHLVC